MTGFLNKSAFPARWANLHISKVEKAYTVHISILCCHKLSRNQGKSYIFVPSRTFYHLGRGECGELKGGGGLKIEQKTHGARVVLF